MNFGNKTKRKNELIFYYTFKKISNIEEEEGNNKIKENKILDNNKNDLNMRPIWQLNNIRKINPKNTNKYLPINSNKNNNNFEKNIKNEN